MQAVKSCVAVLLLTSWMFAQESSGPAAQGQNRTVADPAAAARTAAGCGPNEEQFSVSKDKNRHPVGQPEAGKALVYVFDDPDVSSIQIGQSITRWGLDGKWIGATDARSYFSISVDPGEHRICTSRQSRFKAVQDVSAAMSIKAEAGKTYYIRTQPRAARRSHNEAGVEVVAVDPAEAQILIAKAGLSTFAAKK